MKVETPKYTKIHSSSCERTIIGINNDFKFLQTVNDFLSVDNYVVDSKDKMIGQLVLCLVISGGPVDRSRGKRKNEH
jgi:hypothetical protein